MILIGGWIHEGVLQHVKLDEYETISQAYCIINIVLL